MLPLQDNIPARQFPFVNYIFIAMCTVVFLLQLAVPEGQPTLVEQFGMIPARVQRPDVPVEIPVAQQQVMTEHGPEMQLITKQAAPSPVPAIMTMLTCIFLHGGWMHFIGNMWFLHIFGDNVEDRFGHFGYAMFYLTCGVAASVFHYLSDPASVVPTIGASGAIAGVMGAYLIWYPTAQVKALIPLGYLMQVMLVPAPLFLGIWFVMQAVNVFSAGAGGVAWWAHIGGFLTGLILAFILGNTPLTNPVNTARESVSEGTYRYRRAE